MINSSGLLSAACPCCGYASARKAKACSVCQWELDGRDNHEAFSYSPRNQTNLNLARYRFLTEAVEANFENAKRLRHFQIDETSSFVEEVGPAGRTIYRGPIPFVEYADFGDRRVAAVPIKAADVQKAAAKRKART